MFPLFGQMRLQLGDVMYPAAVHTLLQLSPDPVIYWAEAKTVGWPGSWSMTSGVSRVFSCAVFTNRMGTSVVLPAKVTSWAVVARKLVYFVVDIRRLITPLLINIF